MAGILEVWRRQGDGVCTCCGWNMRGGPDHYKCWNERCFSFGKNGNAKRLRQRAKVSYLEQPVARR